jgi:hypothetical protein
MTAATGVRRVSSFGFGSVFRRVRNRQRAAGSSRLPDLSKHIQCTCPAVDTCPVHAPVPQPPPPVDWPEVQTRHPSWWQVHRVEVHGLERRLVLVAEVRTEDEAFRVADQQASQARIHKWGSRERPYFTHRSPKLVP